MLKNKWKYLGIILRISTDILQMISLQEFDVCSTPFGIIPSGIMPFGIIAIWHNGHLA